MSRLYGGQGDRRSFIGGSDARIVMGKDEVALLRLWKEKRGEVEPEDLSENLLVQLGTVTEQLNRHWYEKTRVKSSPTSKSRFFTRSTAGWQQRSMDG
jgi:predicted phage-related endonuclease